MISVYPADYCHRLQRLTLEYLFLSSVLSQCKLSILPLVGQDYQSEDIVCGL